MALHDLTPQLRTRLSRLERLVGLFVTVATLLMLFGLGFYIYRVAERKGWFLRKLPYYTYVRSGAGLKVGDPIRLMGFDAGEITMIKPMPPEFYYNNVFVAFNVTEPHYGYLWEDSRARVASRDFLGNRFIDVTKGTNGPATYLFKDLRQVKTADLAAMAGKEGLVLGEEIYDRSRTNVVVPVHSKLTPEIAQKIAATGVDSVQIIDQSMQVKAPSYVWDWQNARYRRFPENPEEKGYFLPPVEDPDVAERVATVMNTVEAALPGILDMTNQINRALIKAAGAAGRAEELLASAQPLLTNLTFVTGNITNAKGSLGEWLIPTNLGFALTQTLASANSAVTNASSLLTNTDARLGATLENLANLTSNLNAQVQANTNMLGELSRLIVNADDMVQGLKRHWLLRSAFKSKPTNAPPANTTKTPVRRAVSPKDSK